MTDKGWERVASILQTGAFLIMGALFTDFLSNKTQPENLFQPIWYIIIPFVSMIGLILAIVASNRAGRRRE